jgi:exosortase/archaeosortase family protein
VHRANSHRETGWRAAGLGPAPLPAGPRMINIQPASLQARATGMAALGLIAATLLIFQYQFRHLEAVTAASVMGLITPTLAATQAPIIWFGLGHPHAFGLMITPDCSSGFLLVPLCLLGIGLMIPSRLRTRRVAWGLAGAAAVLVFGNMTRIGVIAAAIRIAGPGFGYELGHLIIGSLISIVCIAVSLIFLTWMVSSPTRLRGRRRSRAARSR